MPSPFRIEVPDAVLVDLRERLHRTRWSESIGDGGGMDPRDVRELASYWADGFDWRAQEARLNAFPQFRWYGIHFIHVRSQRKNATPLLLIHGWPGSFVEMLGVIPLLAPHFDLVVPSLPGYGFSDGAAGMTNLRIAERFAELMTELGYGRFVTQGGDWGAGVSTWLARRFPERLIAMHLNYIPGSYAPHVDGDLTAEEEQFARDVEAWVDRDYAYGRVQRTRPLTLAYGLNDSPAGLLAWIVEKFREWADPSSELSRDELLTNVMIYWVTQSIYSSMRLYRESASTPLRFEPGERLSVPCGIAHFPLEAPFPPRAWIERVYDVRHWTDMPRGGHFAAMEAPELLANDVIAFVDGL